jgi:hypothetical protein
VNGGRIFSREKRGRSVGAGWDSDRKKPKKSSAGTELLIIKLINVKVNSSAKKDGLAKSPKN